MTNDRITSLRELTEKHPLTVRSAARMRQPLDGADAQALEGALAATERERDEARAEVERLRAAMRKIEYLDRPQVRGLPRRVTIQQIALDALAGGKDD